MSVNIIGLVPHFCKVLYICGFNIPLSFEATSRASNNNLKFCYCKLMVTFWLLPIKLIRIMAFCKNKYLCSGESGKLSKLSETELLGLGVASAVTPFFNCSAC